MYRLRFHTYSSLHKICHFQELLSTYSHYAFMVYSSTLLMNEPMPLEVHNELGGGGMKLLLPYLRYYHNIGLGGLSTRRKLLSVQSIRTRNLPKFIHMYINMYDISTSVTHFTSNFGYESKFTLYCGLSGLWYLVVSCVCHPVVKNYILKLSRNNQQDATL